MAAGNGIRPHRAALLTGNLKNRLIDQKWLLIVTGGFALAAVFTGSVSVFWALGSWLAICLTVLLSAVPARATDGGAVAAAKPPPGSPDIVKSGATKGESVAVLAALPYPCFLLHDDSRVIYQNEPARDAVGLIEPGTMISSLIRAPELRQAIKQLIRYRKPVRAEIVRPVPSERHFEIYADLIAVRSDDVENEFHDQVVLSLHDLSQQQRLDQMRADFVANASHELRTPLASLIGFIETLQGPARDDENARGKFLEIMATQAHRMSRLIDDLLSLNRIEMNAHIRPRQKIGFVEVVSHVIDTLQPIAKSAKVKLNLVINADRAGKDDGFQVIGDRDELVQVVQNLVENAIKYGQDGGSVDITLNRQMSDSGPNRLILSVRDHGPGIPKEHQPRLTERFYRIDVASSREKGGTGLGLAIVKHILNRHHGRLHIESTPGDGATFIVTLDEAAPALHDT
ncbi:MAG: hypothetical protein K8F25_00105 [Fimbriimonadaceae bacterium]|nr:hypothetical protein [Alphaproteobacteria bacterium]